MKLQSPFSTAQPNRNNGWYAGRGYNRGQAPAVTMQVSLGCLDKCVGTGAASNCSYCGADTQCWEDCAGSGTGACIRSCFLAESAT